MPHPFTDQPRREWVRDAAGRKLALSVGGYFETGPAVCDWSMPRLLYPRRTPFRRFTLAEWSAHFRAAGFVLTGLYEPRPDAAAVAARPELADCALEPYFLVFDAAKQFPNFPP